MSGKSWLAILFVFALAVGVFLPPLATLELWDRREEHVAADAVDTLHFNHWLVSYDHGLPRLKKPPLARWCSAAALWLTGTANEFVVRLPAGLSALFCCALLYTFGIQWRPEDPAAGRRLGAAAVLLFTTNFLVVSEMWVMSTEPILTAMTTLAILAFWQAEKWAQADRPWLSSLWRLLSGTAMGLGVLTKGPIAMVLVGVAVAGYLACTLGRQAWLPAGKFAAWRTLLHPCFWAPAFLMVSVWGALIISNHPNAPTVWLHEMSIKVAGEERRLPMVLNFLPMSAPWIGLAIAGVVVPVQNRPGTQRQLAWLIWWWCVGNLLMFTCWTGAREPYYLSCMPAMCLLSADAWNTLTQLPRQQRGRWQWALDFQWGISLVLLGIVPAAAWMYAPSLLSAAIIMTVLAFAGCALLWRSRHRLRSLVLVATPIALAALTAGLFIAPEHTRLKSHKRFAEVATHMSQSREQTIWYLNDLGDWQLDYPDSPDVTEGVWFYVFPPPSLIGSFEDLVERVQSQQEQLLLVLTDRQQQLVESHPQLQTKVLAEEQPINRPKTLLVEVSQAPTHKLANR